MKLTLDEIRVVRRMRERGAAVTHLAKDLWVTEGAVRYRLKRLEEGDRLDGRAGQATALDGYEEAVEAIQERLGDRRLRGEGRPCQVRLIYEALVRDHGYAGSLFPSCRPSGWHKEENRIRDLSAVLNVLTSAASGAARVVLYLTKVPTAYV